MRPLLLSAISCCLLTIACLAPGSPPPAIAATAKSPTALGLEIRTEGIYRLTYGYLARHHLSPSRLNVRRLGLSDQGNAVPIYVHHSSNIAVFGRQDYIEFYAHPVFNTYTDVNTYVLTDDGSNVSRSPSQSAGSPSSPTDVAQNTYVDQHRSFFDPLEASAPPYTVSTAWPSTGDAHWKETDLVSYSSQPGTTQSVSFHLPSPNSSGNCSTTVPAVGYPDQATTASASFELGVTVGDSSVINPADGSTSFVWQGSGGSADTIASGTFNCSALGNATGRERRETLTFSSTIQPNVQLEEVMPQYFSITYPEHLCAIHDQLSWQGSGPDGYTISGFDSKHIDIWRVSQGGGVSRVTGAVSRASGNGCGPDGYATSFENPHGGDATYLATAKPLSPAGAAPLDLSSITRGAKGSVRYLIITTAQFASALRPLAAYHDHQGLKAKIVTTQAIYDQYRSSLAEFAGSTSTIAPPGDGQLNPEAIRAYIAFAVGHLGVRYVLIAGGDTIDYHNYYGCPRSRFCAAANPDNVSVVPTLYVDSEYGGVSASDNLYAVPLSQSTTAPDVAIGRFPAVSRPAMSTEVSRSIHWPSWVRSYQKTATFVSGFATGQNYGGNCGDPEFASASDGMAAQLPSAWTISRAYEDGNLTDDRANRAHMLALFDKGQEILNYTGHGNLEQWSCLPELSSRDVASLTNTKRLALVFQWGCEATAFEYPQLGNIDSLLLQAKRNRVPTGAVATVGSSGEDLAYPQAVLAGGEGAGPNGNYYFYGYLRSGLSLGAALERAKDDLVTEFSADSDYADFADVVNSYTILGDPALKPPM